MKRIETIEDAELCYKYCKERLPDLKGYNLHVEQPEETPTLGIRLKVYKGDYFICSGCGVDIDDALLEIYKKLLLYFKESQDVEVKSRKALGRTNYYI